MEKNRGFKNNSLEKDSFFKNMCQILPIFGKPRNYGGGGESRRGKFVSTINQEKSRILPIFDKITDFCKKKKIVQ